MKPASDLSLTDLAHEVDHLLAGGARGKDIATRLGWADPASLARHLQRHGLHTLATRLTLRSTP